MKRNFKQLLLNLVYPPKCVFCGARLSPKASRLVCSECSNALPYTKVYARCKRCGRPIARTQPDTCLQCRTQSRYITRKTAAFIYTGAAKSAVLAFKKERNAGNADTLADYIAEMVYTDFNRIEFDYVISVPPRKKNFTDKSYDQAARLARAVSLKISVPYLNGAMQQTSKIRKQSLLSYSDRARNVKGKFAVRKPNHIKNKTLLIIDDVCTSGSTLNECGKILRENGAYRVYAATLTTIPGIK